MKKDFANKSKKRGNATRFDDNKPDNNGLITIILGVILGIGLTLTAVYYYNQPMSQDTEVTDPAPVKEKPSAKTRYQAVPAEEVEQSDFSFHNELETKTVEVEDEANALPALPEASDRTYTMQCGAFRAKSSAEKVRATVALNNFEAVIKSSPWKGEIWHRVVLGPYSSKRQADRDKNALQRINIECRIW